MINMHTRAGMHLVDGVRSVVTEIDIQAARDPEMSNSENSLHPIRPFLAKNGISPCAGYRFIKEGRLRAVKVGRRTYICEKDWRAFVASLPALKTGDEFAEIAA